MHEFEKYRAPSGADIVELVRRHPFALIVSARPGEAPVATHAPVVIPSDPGVAGTFSEASEALPGGSDASPGGSGALPAGSGIAPDGPDAPRRDPGTSPVVSGTFVGATLLGHIARANPQWQQVADGDSVLLVFGGPHGYVSPTTYGYDPSVPTWDYAAVHLTARVEVLEGAEDCMHIVRETVRATEDLMPTRWDDSASIATFEKIVGGVVGFRLHVTDEKAVFKVSQDKPDDVRERVARDARTRGDAYGDLASLVESQGRLVCPVTGES